MKQKVKDFIKEQKQVSFDKICLFLEISSLNRWDNTKIRQLDKILRDLIIEDFIIFYNGKYCLTKNGAEK